MNLKDFISEALCNPSDYISYYVSRSLAELYPDKEIIEGESYSFDLDEYVSAGLCSVISESSIHDQIETAWQGIGKKLQSKTKNACFDVSWRGQLLDVVLLTWYEGGCESRHHWIIADTREVAENFFREVCEWCEEVRGEVLVFDGGYWHKSKELFAAIRSATFDNLILRGSLKDEIQNDLERFFASREVYENYRIPWKRGILFIGPPGNGKTHTVKALINRLRQPCLYIKSFKHQYSTEHENIRQVFARARRTTPCLVVLEDLDSLVEGKNRSFFLNELDGFAANTGVVILATTNHPEKLDPAILDRPSRFDRKYYFELPGAAERAAYLAAWNERLQPELRLSDPALEIVAGQTEGFSFAYLKELFLSSMMQWIAAPQADAMDAVTLERAAVLRAQMSQMKEEPAPEAASDDDED